jgi:chorismate mutase
MADKTVPLMIRLPAREKKRWERAAELVGEQQKAPPNLSALIRRAVDAEVARIEDEAKGGR